MILCKNCGADLLFVPESQKYECPYCGSSYTPEEVSQMENIQHINAEEQHIVTPPEIDPDLTSMDVYIYTCPQCGGELMTTEETLATFCSYCGSSIQLKQRVERHEKPKYIIPFKVGKQQAMDIYNNTMKGAIFAPGYIRHMDIEKVRGIYMPYWSYSIIADGQAWGELETSHSSPGGTTYNTYKVEGKVHLARNGIEYDAATSFPDDLSQSSAPYHFENAKKFDPSYMSGFYADGGNVPKEVYEKNAESDLLEIAKEDIQHKLGLENDKILFNVKSTITADKCLYPVWFICARNKKENKVSYAVINGETGKIAADIPTNPMKLITGTFIIALPIFLILYLLVTPTPRTTTFIMAIFAIISIIVNIIKWEEAKKLDKKAANKYILNFILCALALITSVLIWFINPFQDVIQYVVAIFTTLCCMISYFRLFKINNDSMVRSLPQFDKRGGDLDA